MISKLEELLSKIKDHPILKKIWADEAKKLLEKRTAAAERIKALQLEAATKLKELREDEKVKKAKCDEAKQQYHIAMNEWGTAWRQSFSASNHYYNLISQEKDKLIETYDREKIDKAIEFFDKKLAWLRTSGTIYSDVTETTSPITLKKKVEIRSNFQPINAALTYCMSAMEKLDKLKLLPAIDNTAIESLKAGIPAIPYT